MRIVAISDLHGYVPEYYKNIDMDVLCICGDISPLKIQCQIPLVKMWIKNRFIPWIESLKCVKCFLIAGNHDFVFRDKSSKELFKNTKIEYLEDNLSTFTLNGSTIKVYGTPWCKIFYDWPFMLSGFELYKKFENIPNNIDILMTHDVPYNTCDILLDKSLYTGENIGNIPLKDSILGKDIKYVLCGHLHSTSHELYQLNNTIIRQCSVVNEKYKLEYKPFIFEL